MSWKSGLAAMVGMIAMSGSVHASDPAPRYTFYGPGMTINAVGAASVYPSSVSVLPPEFPFERIDKATVTIHGYSHTWPDDVWIVLTQSIFPFYKILLMGGCGGSLDVNNIDLTFDQDAAATLADSSQLTSGTYRPTSFGTTPTLPASAPAGPYTDLSVLAGAFPLNDWRLFVYDNVGGEAGTITNWSITFHARVNRAYAQTEEDVVVPLLGTSTPYPSLLNVYGVSGPIQSLSMQITLAHAAPNDLDILLVSPDNRGLVVMSDVGGTAPVNVSISLSDAAAQPIPTTLPSSGGIFSYRPTNVGTSDSFASPALKPPYLTNFAGFAGGPPNGTWRLFVVDDQSLNSGTITRWQLTINGAQFCSADFNRSGIVSVQDVFDFLTDFFAGCP